MPPKKNKLNPPKKKRTAAGKLDSRGHAFVEPVDEPPSINNDFSNDDSSDDESCDDDTEDDDSVTEEVAAATARRLARRKRKERPTSPTNDESPAEVSTQLDIVQYMTDNDIPRDRMLRSLVSWAQQIEDLDSTPPAVTNPPPSNRPVISMTGRRSNRPIVSKYLQKKAAKLSPVAVYNPSIWLVSKLDGITEKTKQQAANQKHLSRDRIVNALDFTGTIHHQCQLIHEILTQGDKASIGAALGLFPNPNLQVEVGTRIVENAKELLASPSCNKRTTNDAIAFRKNAYFIMSATAPLDDASDVVKQPTGRNATKWRNFLNYPSTIKRDSKKWESNVASFS